MPELPEVETVRRLMRRELAGQRIARAKVAPDDIVVVGGTPERLEQALVGSTVADIGRKGKFWWLQLDRSPWLFGHLGMSGWIRALDKPTLRLHSHGEAPLDDEDGMPRFLKMLIETENGNRVAFTDGRRLGRLWLGESPESDPQIAKLGPDVFEEIPSGEELEKVLARRKAPIKALLLNQALFAGVGNWVADEALYQAGIAPMRLANSLSPEEVRRLRDSLHHVVSFAIDAEADHRKYPGNWLFGARWGGKRGADEVDGLKIVRETIGGRTTAWVPEKQK
ncbi:MAG TPA: DNA-formamidopyrimidine glycosylase family protein [Fimbriimonas sp.]